MNLRKYIKSFNLELTTKCTANCPLCARVYLHYKDITYLNLETIKKLPIEDLDKLFISGSLGEPTCYPDFLNLVKYFYDRNPEIAILITTNGYTHKEDWWYKLGKLLNINSYIIVGIDGLEDTHSIYRRGTDFHQIVKNTEAFNNGGGVSVIQTIIFRHNEHQIDDIKDLSKKIGCASMFYRPSKLYTEEFQRPLRQVKTQRDIVEEGGDLFCFITERKELFLNVDGYLVPCYLFSNRREHYPDENEEFLKVYKRNIEYLNLNKYNYDNVINNELFQYVLDNNFNLYTCNNICRCKINDLVNKV